MPPALLIALVLAWAGLLVAIWMLCRVAALGDEDVTQALVDAARAGSAASPQL